MPIIDRFHADPEVFVFLISTLAGGTGLNLTGANKVVIFGKLLKLVKEPPLTGKLQILTGVCIRHYNCAATGITDSTTQTLPMIFKRWIGHTATARHETLRSSVC